MNAILNTCEQEWGNTCNCPYCPGDVDGDGAVGLSDLMTVLSNWGSTLDACAFVPDIDCAPAQSLLGGGGGSTLMSGNSSSSSNEPDFAAVLEEWGFESWDDVAAWMDEASPAEVADFLIALADAVSG